MKALNSLLTIIAVFVAIFAADFLIHNILLKAEYEATAHLWRPQDEFNMVYMFLSQFSFAVIAVYIFGLNYEEKGIAEGIRFGLYLGLLFSLN